MTDERDVPKTPTPPAIIRMPEREPSTLLNRVLARAAARGDHNESVKITNIEHGSQPGERIITFSLTSEEAEKAIKLFTIKPFDPAKSTVTFGNLEVALHSVNGTEIKFITNVDDCKKKWGKAERVKASKAAEAPKLPGRK